jgi:hypothetical protein
VNFIDPFGLEVFGFNTGGGAYTGTSVPVKVQASTAILFESNGRTNRVGIVTTREWGLGVGSGLFWHGVYGDENATIEKYAEAPFSVSGDAMYASYSYTCGDDSSFHEAGFSSGKGPGGAITFPDGSVDFVFEYSFGAADTYWGNLIFDIIHN